MTWNRLETVDYSNVHSREILISLSTNNAYIFPGRCPMYKKRINTAGLGWLPLERAAWVVGPWLASGKRDSGRVPSIPRLKSGSLC